MTSSSVEEEGHQHWLVYDGACAFCRRAIAWVSQHDRARRFRPVPYQTAPSPPLTPALRAQAAAAVLVITAEGRCFSAGRAVLFVLKEIGWHPRLVRVLTCPPLSWLVEIGYRIVAAHRGFFGRFLFRAPE